VDVFVTQVKAQPRLGPGTLHVPAGIHHAERGAAGCTRLVERAAKRQGSQQQPLHRRGCGQPCPVIKHSHSSSLLRLVAAWAHAPHDAGTARGKREIHRRETITAACPTGDQEIVGGARGSAGEYSNCDCRKGPAGDGVERAARKGTGRSQPRELTRAVLPLPGNAGDVPQQHLPPGPPGQGRDNPAASGAGPVPPGLAASLPAACEGTGEPTWSRLAWALASCGASANAMTAATSSRASQRAGFTAMLIGIVLPCHGTGREQLNGRATGFAPANTRRPCGVCGEKPCAALVTQ